MPFESLEAIMVFFSCRKRDGTLLRNFLVAARSPRKKKLKKERREINRSLETGAHPHCPDRREVILLRDLNAAEAEGSKIRTENGNNNDDEKYRAVILAK